MARINIEDSIYRDPRFIDLCIALGGDRLKALGTCVAAWDLAQKHFLKTPHHTIPMEAWKIARIPECFIEVGLARITDSGVYVNGTNDHCTYLLDRSIAGRKGGLKTQEIISSKLKQIQPSSSSSSSSSSSGSGSKKINTYAQQVERVYQDLYPLKLGKSKGLKKLAREVKSDQDLVDFEKAVRHYASYAQGKDRAYIKHFSTFVSEWRDWIKPEESPTRTDWKKIFGEDYVPEST